MRLDMGKVNRSGVYYLINTVTPINHSLKAELDAFGSVIVVVLLLGVVSLVRFACLKRKDLGHWETVWETDVSSGVIKFSPREIFRESVGAECSSCCRLQPPPGDEPLHRVQQFQPVLQRRFRHGLPLIKTLFALEKQPLAATRWA